MKEEGVNLSHPIDPNLVLLAKTFSIFEIHVLGTDNSIMVSLNVHLFHFV